MGKIHISHIRIQVENLSITDSQLCLDIDRAVQKAKDNYESVVISYAGMYDLLVHPSGNFQLISTIHSKMYQLLDDSTYLQEV